MNKQPIDWTGHPPFGREVSLKHTLELLHERRNGKTENYPTITERLPLIVEIGTSESYNPNGLGNALLAFAWYEAKYGAKVESVDVREGALINSWGLLGKYVPELWPGLIGQVLGKNSQVSLKNDKGSIGITRIDAYEWAPLIHEPIDLLYVDAGYELECDPDYAAFISRHSEIPSNYIELFCQFEEGCFQSGALMLFDDTDPATFNGKGKRLIPFLLGVGWRQVELHGVPVFPMALLEKM